MMKSICGCCRRTWLVIAVGIVLAIGVVGLLLKDREEIPLPSTLRITAGKTAKVEYLEVPLVRYTKKAAGLRVDFVGAVHLGEKRYYADLNKRFQRYDAVLFELVSDGENLPQLGEERPDSLLGKVQRGMADLVGLSFQLDEIDYRARNFVHADLSPDELSRAMSQRGESLPQLLMKLMRLSFDPEVEKAMREKGVHENTLDGINPFLILLRGPTPDERLKIRRFLAHGLAGSDVVLKALEGDAGISLIADRNQQAISVLKREVAAGKRNVAIFYGAGHLPDFHNRMVADGYRISGVEWMQAWTM